MKQKLLFLMTFLFASALSANALGQKELQRLLDKTAGNLTRGSSDAFTEIDISEYTEPFTSTLYVRAQNIRFVNGTLTRSSSLSSEPLIQIQNGYTLEIASSVTLDGNNVNSYAAVVDIENGTFRVNGGKIKNVYDDLSSYINPVYAAAKDINLTKILVLCNSVKLSGGSNANFEMTDDNSGATPIPGSVAGKIQNDGGGNISIDGSGTVGYIYTSNPFYLSGKTKVTGYVTLANSAARIIPLSALQNELHLTGYALDQAVVGGTLQNPITGYYGVTDADVKKIVLDNNTNNYALSLENSTIYIRKASTNPNYITNEDDLQKRLDEIAAENPSEPVTLTIRDEGIIISGHLEFKKGCNVILTGGKITISASGFHSDVVFLIEEGANVTYRDITIDFNNKAYIPNVFFNYGKLTISTGVTYLNILEITTFYGNWKGGKLYVYSGNVTISSGTLISNEGTVYLYGGTLQCVSPQQVVYQGSEEDTLYVYDGSTLRGYTPIVDASYFFMLSGTIYSEVSSSVISKPICHIHVRKEADVHIGGYEQDPIIYLYKEAVIDSVAFLGDYYLTLDGDWQNMELGRVIIKNVGLFHRVTFVNMPSDREAYFDATDNTVKLRAVNPNYITNEDDLQKRLDEIAAENPSEPVELTIRDNGIIISKHLEFKKGCNVILTGGKITISASGFHSDVVFLIEEGANVTYRDITIDFNNKVFIPNVFFNYGKLTISTGVTYLNIPKECGRFYSNYKKGILKLYSGDVTISTGTLIYNEGYVGACGGILRGVSAEVVVYQGSGDDSLYLSENCTLRGYGPIVDATQFGMDGGTLYSEGGGSVITERTYCDLGGGNMIGEYTYGNGLIGSSDIDFPVFELNGYIYVTREVSIRILEDGGVKADKLPTIYLHKEAFVRYYYNYYHYVLTFDGDWQNMELGHVIVKEISAEDFTSLKFINMPSDREAYYDATDNTVKLRATNPNHITNEFDLQKRLDEIAAENPSKPVTLIIRDEGITISKQLEFKKGCNVILTGGKITLNTSGGFLDYAFAVWAGADVTLQDITIGFNNKGGTYNDIWRNYGKLTISTGVTYLNVSKECWVFYRNYKGGILKVYSGDVTISIGTLVYNEGYVALSGGTLQGVSAKGVVYQGSGDDTLTLDGNCTLRGYSPIVDASTFSMYGGTLYGEGGGSVITERTYCRFGAGNILGGYTYGNGNIGVSDIDFPLFELNGYIYVTREVSIRILEDGGVKADKLPTIYLHKEAFVRYYYNYYHYALTFDGDWQNMELGHVIVKEISAEDFTSLKFINMPSDREAYYDATDNTVKLRATNPNHITNELDLQKRLDEIAAANPEEPVVLTIQEGGIVLTKEITASYSCKAIITGGNIEVSSTFSYRSLFYIAAGAQLEFRNITFDFHKSYFEKNVFYVNSDNDGQGRLTIGEGVKYQNIISSMVSNDYGFYTNNGGIIVLHSGDLPYLKGYTLKNEMGWSTGSVYLRGDLFVQARIYNALLNKTGVRGGSVIYLLSPIEGKEATSEVWTISGLWDKYVMETPFIIGYDGYQLAASDYWKMRFDGLKNECDGRTAYFDGVTDHAIKLKYYNSLQCLLDDTGDKDTIDVPCEGVDALQNVTIRLQSLIDGSKCANTQLPEPLYPFIHLPGGCAFIDRFDDTFAFPVTVIKYVTFDSYSSGHRVYVRRPVEYDHVRAQNFLVFTIIEAGGELTWDNAWTENVLTPIYNDGGVVNINGGHLTGTTINLTGGTMTLTGGLEAEIISNSGQLTMDGTVNTTLLQLNPQGKVYLTGHLTTKLTIDLVGDGSYVYPDSYVIIEGTEGCKLTAADLEMIQFILPEGCSVMLDDTNNTIILINPGQEVSVDKVKAVSTSSSLIYDTQGRNVESPVKGQIYVKDGRKYIAE